MRLIAFILNIMIVVFSCLPCSDANASEKTGVQYEMSTAKSTHHDHQKDSCSPFCICSCCAMVYMHTGLILFTTNGPLGTPVYNNFLSPHTQQIAIAIWQPPKL